ncbi:bifunctional serine/threonine-protein kinase/formylglycine-generating enzyme family protein [Prosthecobacter sp.]|uniref:bifunctional serine/threonine-protein kinase/formylglycine-generating enzyme family protein n=1 Tax=Prosthecobacter sp. TaxID=1965333 RepID=UPI001D27C83E|nr:bifunctional serine/threonine-protein kinase/formylglycine-generating enzyme family protein [Prosthecobacter sp.]MCB1279284.1 protein kinase [Prosthecobacter sp.]
MSTGPSTPENDANLSALGRELLGAGGSKPSGPWVPPTAEELHKLLPEYEIVKMLGRGGMGAVYMGRQIALDRPVAIKILSNTLEDSDMGFKERFKNEAKAMAKLSFMGIVKVHDFGETSGGLLYIVMEYVEGTDVARMISKNGRLPQEHAMAITAHVCDALAYAHGQGIIHRDIKPANIMVDCDGVVKVADFGLAKINQGIESGLTQSGMAMGTLHYMAPEALMLGTAVDHRADIYALGVMLYQMLTGKLPQGMFELPSMLIPGVDPRYDRVIAKALREDRETRYQSAVEMRADLDGILTQPMVKIREDAPDVTVAPPKPTHSELVAQADVDELLLGKGVSFDQRHPHRTSRRQVWAATALLLMLSTAYLIWPRNDEAPSEKVPLTESPPPTLTPAPPPPSPPEPVTVATKPVPPATPMPSNPTTTPAPPAKMPVPEPAKPRVDGLIADGKWQDVLKILSGPKAVTYGAWQFAEGHLDSPTATRNAATIGVPTETLADYDAYISVRSANHQALGFLLPTPGGAMNLLIHRGSGVVVLANGFTFGSNRSTRPFDRNPADGRVHEFFIRVTAKRVTVTFDGDRIYDYAPRSWDNVRPNVDKKFPLGKTPTLGLRVNGGSATFFAFQVRAPGNDADHKSPVPPLTELPGFQSRVAKYQAARQQQLADLCSRYQKALTAAHAAAVGTGNLGHVEAIMKAVENATRHAAEIDKLPSSRIVAALDALPPLGDDTPDSLKRLREIFDEETQKFESGLAAELDQSFDFLNAELVQKGDIVSAQALQTYRHKTHIRSARLHQTTQQRPFVNSLGMRFVPLPGTELLMCIHETRKGDFRAFANTIPYKGNNWESVTWQNLPVSETDDHPVIVRYDGAVSFTEWLSYQEKLTYRLPTDNEWSIAAGLGGSETSDASSGSPNRELPSYVWGDKFPPPRGTGNFADDTFHYRVPNQRYYLRSYNDGFPTTAPVMRYAPNVLGLFDLAGNVWELCSGWYNHAESQRSLRGGSFATSASYQLAPGYRSPIRDPNDPRESYSSPNESGFRCVLELPELTIIPAPVASSATTSIAASPGSGSDASSTSTSLSELNASDIINRRLEFHREAAKNAGLICKLRLNEDGSIQGSGNRNETRWKLRDGLLLFLNPEGNTTTVFDEFQMTEGKWQFKGPALGRSGITHILKGP